ncbi:cell wall-active antibiotics response protein LiaF [Robertmurraya korlensis]|uniref:cell wall-active antibiotics response protein LiaF n=1 Tax=Robertmurraya korlensis TaxID=519977 RepID=UPI0008253FD2|nr:cell wall-active antibiotics response protein LiaF [Robertmurraya korlensis]
MRYQTINQVLFAIMLLLIGGVLLLANLGVISLEITELFVVSYPFLLLIIAMILFIKALVERESFFLSIFLLLLSSILILDRFGKLDFGFWEFWKLWPYIIIYIGLNILSRKNKIKFHFNEDMPKDAFKSVDEKERKNQRKRARGFSIGDVSFKQANWSVEPMELYNTIGDYFIDFSQAYIPEKETPIIVQGWIGDVKMIIPEDVPVFVQSYIKVGDIRIFDKETDSINRGLTYQSPGYEEAVRKLKITIELKIGSVRIDKV